MNETGRRRVLSLNVILLTCLPAYLWPSMGAWQQGTIFNLLIGCLVGLFRLTAKLFHGLLLVLYPGLVEANPGVDRVYHIVCV
jgi:hypothetical protein